MMKCYPFLLSCGLLSIATNHTSARILDPKCAVLGEVAKDCGGSGNSPKSCCNGLSCSNDGITCGKRISARFFVSCCSLMHIAFIFQTSRKNLQGISLNLTSHRTRIHVGTKATRTILHRQSSASAAAVLFPIVIPGLITMTDRISGAIFVAGRLLELTKPAILE